MGHGSIEQIVAMILVLFVGVGLHEYSHCKFADLAGDPTPRYYGRMTLNLFKHFEPVGTIMMVLSAISGYGIGWGRAAPMDPRKMRNPRWDFFIAVIAGPLSNVLQAVIYALVLRIVIKTSPTILFDAGGFTFVGNLLFSGVVINLTLAVFNMLPIGPLDGHWLLGLLMPELPRHHWFQWNRQYGRMALIGLILFSQYAENNGHPELNVIGRIIYPIIDWATHFFFGRLT